MAETYVVLDQVKLNKWDGTKQEAVEGWQVRYRWVSNNVVGDVFVPVETYNATNVDAAIRQAGAVGEQVSALGAAPGAPPPPAA